MSAIHETFLTLTEVDEQLKKLEEKYGGLTKDFLLDAEFRATVSEDDFFQWEAFLSHRAELVEIDSNVRRQYLKHVSQAPEASEPAPGEKQVLLAA